MINPKTKFLIIFLVFLIVILFSIQFFKKPEQEVVPILPVIQQELVKSNSDFTIISPGSLQAKASTKSPIIVTFSKSINLDSLVAEMNPLINIAPSVGTTGKELILTPRELWNTGIKYELIIKSLESIDGAKLEQKTVIIDII